MHAQEITFFNAALIALIIFGVVCGCFIFFMFKQHRKNITLYRAKVASEITTLEQERRRIADDLHDDLGPLLAAIKLNIEAIDAPPEDAELVVETEETIDEVVQKLRQISNDLMPATLVRKGFTHAIDEYLEKVRGGTPMKITFNATEMPPLSDEMNINLYRILLEIIHNTLKHAQAQNFSVTVIAHAKDICIETKDDGRGFETETTVRTSNGRGLSNILNRAELLEGDLYIESKPGKGTAYLLTIPYQTTAHAHT